MTKNRVFFNEHNIIEIIVNGDQTVNSVMAMADEAEDLLLQCEEKDEPALVLDNLLHIGNVPPEARRKVVERAKSLDYDKLAFVGNGRVLRFGSNLILQAIGKGDKLKYFENYDAAIAWLKS
jgi:UDP-N-acetylmuramyl pentapeptide synthase